jgi:patatin-like phospholipase/acyl hydrolase
MDTDNTRKKRILTIDGGGVKGAFPASFLASIESMTGKRVSNYFDLIVGTSTGGIIALGMGMGMSSADLRHFYLEYGPKIFASPPWWKRLPWWKSLGFVTRAKYDPTPLHNALEEEFGDRKLGESSTRLVIPSLNLENGKVHLYKTAHHERFKIDYTERAIDVARATSAAPTYFPSHVTPSGVPLIDGGVWANNPMAVAVVEALAVLEWPPEDVHLLSLGCTSEPFDAREAHTSSKGFFYWGLRSADLFMSAQASSAFGMAKLLLGGTEQIHRIDPVVADGKFDLDKTEGITGLVGLGKTRARYALPEIEHVFFDEPAADFTPYRSL